MEYTEIIGPHLHGPCVTYSVYEGIGRLHIAIYRETEFSKILQGVVMDVKPEDLEGKLKRIKRWKEFEGAMEFIKGGEVHNYMDEILDKGKLIDFTMVSLCGRLYRYVYFSDMGETGEKAYKYLTNNE